MQRAPVACTSYTPASSNPGKQSYLLANNKTSVLFSGSLNKNQLAVWFKNRCFHRGAQTCLLWITELSSSSHMAQHMGISLTTDPLGRYCLLAPISNPVPQVITFTTTTDAAKLFPGQPEGRSCKEHAYKSSAWHDNKLQCVFWWHEKKNEHIKWFNMQSEPEAQIDSVQIVQHQKLFP